MRFLYVSDLHGDQQKYNALLNLALQQKVSLLHLGADLLPKGSGILKVQKEFCKKFLKDFCGGCQEKKIKVLGMFGNDDIPTRREYVRPYLQLLDEHPQVIEGLTFSGYPYVPDYPFGLKSWCKYDHDGFVPEPYISAPVEADETGFVEIKDPEEYFRRKGTIEDDLRHTPADRSTVIAIHTPPVGLGLDLVQRGMGMIPVGSKAVRSWVENRQPLIVLSGHIHEAYEMFRQWRGMIGDTMVIQPGQMGPGSRTMAVVDITIEGGKVDARREEIPVHEYQES